MNSLCCLVGDVLVRDGGFKGVWKNVSFWKIGCTLLFLNSNRDDGTNRGNAVDCGC